MARKQGNPVNRLEEKFFEVLRTKCKRRARKLSARSAEVWRKVFKVFRTKNERGVRLVQDQRQLSIDFFRPQLVDATGSRRPWRVGSAGGARINKEKLLETESAVEQHGHLHRAKHTGCFGRFAMKNQRNQFHTCKCVPNRTRPERGSNAGVCTC